jgi:uncharacterized protein (TIGR03437 family)
VIVYLPVDLPAGPASVVVRNHLGINSASFSFPVQQYAPGLSNSIDQRTGRSIGMFIDSRQRIVSAGNPAAPGQPLTLYAVGLGPTNPVVPTGETASASTTTSPSLYIGGRVIPVFSAGLGCGFICEPGTFMVGFLLPPDMPAGDHPVYLEIGGRRSNIVSLIAGPSVSEPLVGYLQSMYDPNSRAMSPGALAWVGGGGFRSDQGSATCGTDPSVWPLACYGVTVTINGRAAALQAVTPNSVAMQIPVELPAGPATLIVERLSGTQLLRSAPFAFTLDAVSPALATQTALPPYASAIILPSGGSAAPTYPVVPGDMIFLQASGLGQTLPPLVTGFSPPFPARTLLIPTVTIGGRPCESVTAEVLPGSVGVYRITATAPKGLPDGDLPVVLEVGGRRSQSGLMLPVSSKPAIAAVTNAASGLPGVASGSWITIYGRNLASATREWREDDIIYDWLPTSLEGVVVSINDIAAVISYVSPTQLNVLAPDNLPPGPVDITVQNSIGWQITKANVKTYSPGMFALQAPPGNSLGALHSDWSYVAKPGQLPPSYSAWPARPGETIVLYGTGFGATTPEISGRHRYNGAAPLANPASLSIQIGGRPAQVVFAGLVGNGLYQINVVVPDLPIGDHEVVAVIGGESSPRGRFIPIQR